MYKRQGIGIVNTICPAILINPKFFNVLNGIVCKVSHGLILSMLFLITVGEKYIPIKKTQ